MTDAKSGQQAMSDDALHDLVASTDPGARAPTGFAEKVLLGTALLWSLFQLWYASPIPFMVAFGVFNADRYPYHPAAI